MIPFYNPTRSAPREARVPTPPRGFIGRSWHGSEKLWKVWWLYFYLLSAFIVATLDQLHQAGFISERLAALIIMPYIVWIMVSLWRCAANCNWRRWTLFARCWALVLGLITLPYLAFAFFIGMG